MTYADDITLSSVVLLLMMLKAFSMVLRQLKEKKDF